MSAPLTHHSARVLEFDALRELLRGYASSPLGQAKSATLAPSIDPAWIEEQQALDRERCANFAASADASISPACSTLHNWWRSLASAEPCLRPRTFAMLCLLVDRAAEWREIALHPPASMRTEWRAITHAFGKHPRLHRVPPGLPQQNSARWDPRRSRIAGTLADSPRN